MKVNFFCRSKVKGQPATVYLRCSDKRGQDIWVRTPELVYPEYWSGKQGRIFKPNISYNTVFTEKAKVETESRLSELRQHILSSRLTLKTDVTKEWLLLMIDKFYKRTVDGETLNMYLDRYVNELESGVRLIYGARRYTKGSVNVYKSTRNTIKEFQGIYTKERIKELTDLGETLRKRKEINFNNITSDFMSEFQTFCIEREYKPNSISCLITRFKTILKQGYEEGVHTNEEFKRKSFSTKKYEVMDVYLNENELNSIFKLRFNSDLPFDRKLKVVRDVFLCGCYTAQRFSDYSCFKPENIKEYSIPTGIKGERGKMKVLDFIQTKTGHRCIVPIREELDTILNRYHYKLPKIDYKEACKLLKVICQKAGIDEPIVYEYIKGGKKIIVTVPKYKLVKSHTARRSGATNMKVAGMPLEDIAKIGGWKNLQTLQRYLKLSEEETAISLANNPFFKGSLLKVV